MGLLNQRSLLLNDLPRTSLLNAFTPIKCYSQCSYNKWHKTEDPCPFCRKEAESIFHVILHCDFITDMWNQLHTTLSKLHSKPLDDAEKAFGIVDIKSTPGVVLRNWLGFKLREKVLLSERSAYHQARKPSVEQFKAKFNQSVANDVKILMYRLKNEGKLQKYDEIVGFKGVVCAKIGTGEYKFNEVLN